MSIGLSSGRPFIISELDRIPGLLLELERFTAILLSHDLVAIEHHLRNLRTDFVIQSLSDLSD